MVANQYLQPGMLSH